MPCIVVVLNVVFCHCFVKIVLCSICAVTGEGLAPVLIYVHRYKLIFNHSGESDETYV